VPEDYGAESCERPRSHEGSDGPPQESLSRDETARFFVCGRCRAQSVVCRRCDRGQIYCAGGCAGQARREAQRVAARRYQRSRRGRFKHAERSRRYRARAKNVTHHGSTDPRTVALLCSVSPACVAEVLGATNAELPSLAVRTVDDGDALPCHWCGRSCPAFVRQDFLRRRRTLRFSSA